MRKERRIIGLVLIGIFMISSLVVGVNAGCFGKSYYDDTSTGKNVWFSGNDCKGDIVKSGDICECGQGSKQIQIPGTYCFNCECTGEGQACTECEKCTEQNTCTFDYSKYISCGSGCCVIGETCCSEASAFGSKLAPICCNPEEEICGVGSKYFVDIFNICNPKEDGCEDPTPEKCEGNGVIICCPEDTCSKQVGFPVCKEDDCPSPKTRCGKSCCDENEVCKSKWRYEYCSADSCPEGQTKCTGTGEASEGAICCPAGTFCHHHPNGVPRCISVTGEPVGDKRALTLFSLLSELTTENVLYSINRWISDDVDSITILRIIDWYNGA